MVITSALVQKTFEEVNVMMKKCFKGLYDKPKFSFIKITHAHSYWMKIRKFPDHWGLSVSDRYKYFTSDDAAMRKLKESMAHELIHTLPGAFNHGKFFKEYGKMFHSYYPEYTISTTSGGGDSYVAPERKYRYKITCKRCGATFMYQRYTKAVKLCEQEHVKCRCSRCGSNSFTVEKLV